MTYNSRPHSTVSHKISATKKAMRIIYSLDYHGHTSVFFHCSKILKLEDLITHRTIVMLYKANNHCLEGRVQALFEPTAAVHKHDTRQSKLFYVKKSEHHP